jgi:hypothetical protein
LIMAAPITHHQTFLILEATRGLDARQRDNFVDFVAHELRHLDPTDHEVEQAIRLAKRAMRKAGAN